MSNLRFRILHGLQELFTGEKLCKTSLARRALLRVSELVSLYATFQKLSADLRLLLLLVLLLPLRCSGGLQ